MNPKLPIFLLLGNFFLISDHKGRSIEIIEMETQRKKIIIWKVTQPDLALWKVILGQFGMRKLLRRLL